MTEQLTSLALRQFVDSCRSPSTRRTYQKSLRNFMKYLGVETEDYDLLVKKDPAHIQMDLCQWISFLRQKGKSSSTISTWVAAINKFYTMNDVTTLNWKKNSAGVQNKKI